MLNRRSLLTALGGSSVPLLLLSGSAEARSVTTAGRPSERNLMPSGGNDSTQVQNAIDQLVATGGGDLVLNSGGWRFDQTVKMPRPEVTGVRLNMTGLGTPTIRGAANPLLRVESNWGYSLSGFDMVGNGRQGTGVWFARENGVGTQGGQSVIERVNVGGFERGMRFGSGDVATSEIVLTQCAAKDCAVGFDIEGYNTLDISFVMLNLGQNATGVRIVNGGSVSVFGGSASNSTDADFRFLSAQSLTLNGFRSEGANRVFVQQGYSPVTNVNLYGCDLRPSSNPDRVLIYAKGGGLLNVDGSRVCGRIQFENNGYSGRVVLKATGIAAPVPLESPYYPDLPFDFQGISRIEDNGDLIRYWPNGSGLAGPGGLAATEGGPWIA